MATLPIPAIAKSLLDALDEPAMIVRSGRLLYANEAAHALLGPRSEGQDIRLIIRHPQALDHILSRREGGIDILGLGGGERPWQLTTTILDRDLMLVRLIDRSQARAAERMRVDFVANASHELRTPLATILGYAETIAEEAPVPDALRMKFGATIGTEAKRMLRIVEDLMGLSRIEADRFRAPDQAIDPAEIVQIAADNGRKLAEDRGCSIVTDPVGDLPTIRGDFGQLLQLLDNLIANAIRYGCGAQACTVTVAARIEAGQLLLAVSDDGEGIAPEHLPRLTERFYRVDAARSRDSGGTGLGLAIVKHIVERHRGTLDIRSAPGRGTQVQVRIPLD